MPVNDIYEAPTAIDADWFLCFESELRSDVVKDDNHFAILNIDKQQPPQPISSATTASSRRYRPIIPHARLTSSTGEGGGGGGGSSHHSSPRSAAAQRSKSELPTNRQVYLPELAHVMDPSHFICKWLLRQQLGSAGGSSNPGWQHSLLYRPRGYVAMEMVECREPGRLVELPSFKPYLFYRKMLQSFLDNWIAPRVLLHSMATATNNFPPKTPKSESDLDRSRPADEPPTLPSGSLHGVCFYIPPFSLFATRVSGRDMKDLSILLPNERELSDLVGRVTLDFIAPREPEEWLRNIAADLRTHHTIPLPTSTFFGLPWKQWCRVVIRCTNAAAPSYKNRTLTDALCMAAEGGDGLAISSEEFKPIYIGLPVPDLPKKHYYTPSSSAGPGPVPALALPLRQVVPSTKPTPLLMEAHRRARAVVWLVGGKDMLALDWLPYISRSLHYSISRRALEHVNSGDASSSPPPQHRFDRSAIRSIHHPVYLMYEYPGYGFSACGQSPEECVTAACESLTALLKVQDVSSDIDLTVVAYSLGCSIALQTCVEILRSRLVDSQPQRKLGLLRLRTLVLLAPPTTISACAAHMLKLPSLVQPLAVKLFDAVQSSSMAWNNLDTIKVFCQLVVQGLPDRLDPPKIFVLHGGKDNMVSPNMGRAVYVTANDTYLAALKASEEDVAQDPLKIARKRAIQSALNNLKFELVAEATHLSIVGNPQYQARIHEFCYDARQVSIVRTE